MTTIISVAQACGGSADTSEQGEFLGKNMLVALATDADIVVSFKRISTVTTNFVAASFCVLLDDHELDEIKRRVSVIYSTRQINDMIKRMMGAR